LNCEKLAGGVELFDGQRSDQNCDVNRMYSILLTPGHNLTVC